MIVPVSQYTDIGVWYNPATWPADWLTGTWLGIPRWTWLVGGAAISFLLFTGEKSVQQAPQVSPANIRIAIGSALRRAVRRKKVHHGNR